MPALATRPGQPAAATLFDPPAPERRRATLEQSLLVLFEELAIRGNADCPVCSAGRVRADAPCGRCGSEIG